MLNRSQRSPLGQWFTRTQDSFRASLQLLRAHPFSKAAESVSPWLDSLGGIESGLLLVLRNKYDWVVFIFVIAVLKDVDVGGE